MVTRLMIATPSANLLQKRARKWWSNRVPYRINPAQYDKIKYKERNRSERSFNCFKQFRADATRYYKLDVMLLVLLPWQC